jgi:peroxiredoxin
MAQRTIEVELQNAPKGYFYLHKISGDDHVKIDSSFCQNRKLIFTGNYASGMYYINQGMNAFSFLVNEDHIKFSSDFSALQHHLKIIDSKENKIWFQYLERRNEMFQKLKMLKPITLWYDKASPFHQQAVLEYQFVQKNFHDFLHQIPTNTMVHDFAWADVKPKLLAELSFEEQIGNMKTKWFDQVNWANSNLINSDILTNKIKDYLGLYNQKGLNRKQLQEGFKTAIEQILPFAVQNEKLGKFVVHFLLKEFERYALDEVIVHVSEIYSSLGKNCEMEGSDSALQLRLKKYEQMSIGKTAPDFTLPNLNGELFHLKKNLKEKNLIVFWSTACPHCLYLLPQLNKWYLQAEKKGWNVIAISLDSKEKDLKDIMQKMKLNFTILCDYKRWNGTAVVDYNIHATPTMIVLDQNAKIVSKPIALDEID